MNNPNTILLILVSFIGIISCSTNVADSNQSESSQYQVMDNIPEISANEVAENFINWYDTLYREPTLIYTHEDVHSAFTQKIKKKFSAQLTEKDPVIDMKDCICCAAEEEGKPCQGELLSDNGTEAIVRIHGFAKGGTEETDLKVKLKKQQARWLIVDTFR